jgi:ribosomal protein S24E
MEEQSNTRNELFKRNELKFVFEGEKNPGFDESRKLVSKSIKKPEEFLDVFRIKGSFGTNKFLIEAHAYDSVEALKKAEQKTQKQRALDKESAKKTYEESKKPAEVAKEESTE